MSRVACCVYITLICIIHSSLALNTVLDEEFNQIISHQSSYEGPSSTSLSILPFNHTTAALYDANGRCFVSLSSDRILWTSRRVTHPVDINWSHRSNIYGDWIHVYDFTSLLSPYDRDVLKFVKAPDSIVIVSSLLVIEVVMDFQCKSIVSLETRLRADESWGNVYSLTVGHETLWMGTDAGLLRVDMNNNGDWDVQTVDDIPISPPVTALLWVDAWQILFVGTADAFYELRFQWPKYSVRRDWVGGNLDSPVVGMEYDEVGDRLWVVESDALHQRDNHGLWWREGYYQGAISDNLTSVCVQFLAGQRFVWTGSIDMGLSRLHPSINEEWEDKRDPWDKWLLFYGPRFTPDGSVRQLVSDSQFVDEKRQDSTVLVVTETGVTMLSVRRWKLANKAEVMQELQYPRHDRGGISAEVSLSQYGDLTTWLHSPEDSDSIWTAQYAVAAAIRYYFSNAETDREMAWRAFEALELLGNLTGVDGLVGRTMCSPEEARGARSTVGCGVDGENNWHASQTYPGWVWKGDTSSDTVNGHYFAYGLVLDLVASSPEERARAENAIERITTYIVSNNLYYIDVTGEPTKWGRWNPADLNENPQYISERGVNSLEILAFLALAYSVTGRELYHQQFFTLAVDYGYYENCANQKIDNPFDDNHSDNQLGFMAYHTLFYAQLRLEKEVSGLLEEERELRLRTLKEMTAPVLPSLRRWWSIVRNERSPLWLSAVAGAGGIPVQFDDVERAVQSLQLWSTDMIAWGIHNTGRWDCETQPYYGRDDPTKIQMRYIRPPQERATGHWNVWFAYFCIDTYV